MEETKKKKKGFKVPHVYALLLCIILVCSLLTYIIPAGNYDTYVNDSGRSVVDPTTFHWVDQTPVGFYTIFGSIFDGMVEAGEIIFLCFVCGGAFGVVFSTGAIDSAIVRLALKMKGKERAIIPIMVTLFAFMGMTGSAEDFIIYIPVVMTMCLAMGFDSMTACALCILSGNAGWCGTFANLYTEGVAQGICELPIFSGLEFRVVMFVFFYTLAMIYMMRYSKKIKNNPESSLMYEIDKQREGGLTLDLDEHPFGVGEKIVAFVFFAVVLFTIVGCLKLGWWYEQITAVYVAMAVFAGLVTRMSLDDWGKSFGQGLTDMAVGALVIGVARGILIVLNSGNIIHTMLYGAANILNGLPKVVCAEGIYIFQCLTNYIIPSGSGQAAVTMPLMAPLADIVGVTRQTACICYQLGDGISNIFTPTSGYMMACIAVAKIPYEKWAKFVLPFIGIEYAMGAVFVAVAAAINLGPF